MASGSVIRLAVFGNPIAQSLSPAIHRAFAQQCGLNIDYRTIEANSDSFPGEVMALARQGGRGCNITAPFKHAAWKLARQCSDNAQRAQAANTLVFESPGEWYADSTDGMGLVNDLKSGANTDLKGARICLLGAGGAAAGVLAALLACDPELIVLANRTLERARKLTESHADLGEIAPCIPAELQNEAPFDLFINATSLGHRGQSPVLSSDWLNPDALCYDMNYGTAAEPLRAVCREHGIPYSDGLGMLVGQAALSFTLWTGETPDTGAVLDQLRSTPG